MKKILSLSLVAAVLVGCGGGSKTLVGSWTPSGANMDTMPAGSTATMSFQDTTFSLTVKSDTQGPTGKMKSEMAFSGDYKINGEQITMTFKDIKAKVDNPAAQSMFDAAMKAQKESLLANMNKTNSGTLVWEGSDKVSIKSGDGKNSLNLTRTK